MKVIESSLDEVKVAVSHARDEVWVSLTLPDLRGAGVRLTAADARLLIRALGEALPGSGSR